MRPTIVIGAVLLALGVLAPPVESGEIIQGRVTAINSASLDIDGHTYVMTDRTSCEDKAGRRVDPSEVAPGTPVEAEIEDGGKLGVVTVDLLR